MADLVDQWLATLSEDSWYRGKIESWSPAQREDFSRLMNTLTKMGCRDPGSWAFSEVSEGIPQCTKYAFLKGVTAIVDSGSKMSLDDICETYQHHPTLQQAIAKVKENLSPSETEILVAAIGSSFATEVVDMVDQGYSPDSVVVMDTLWSLQEGNDEGLTGRELDGVRDELDDDDNDQDFVPAVLRMDDNRRTTR